MPLRRVIRAEEAALAERLRWRTGCHCPGGSGPAQQITHRSQIKIILARMILICWEHAGQLWAAWGSNPEPTD